MRVVFALSAFLFFCSLSAQAQPEVKISILNGPFETHISGPLPEAFSIVPWSINNNGEAVGWCQGPQTRLRGFIWRAGRGIQQLPTPDGFSDSYAYDISNSGYILGICQNGISGTMHPWRSKEGVVQVLAVPEECYAVSHLAINDRGDFVVQSSGCNNSSRVYLYRDGVGYTDLGAQSGLSSAFDINNGGWVTGAAAGQAALWHPDHGLTLLGHLPAPYDDFARGEAINENNHVAGVGINDLTSRDHWRAGLWISGQPPIRVSHPIIARSTAYGVNEHGYVVGTDGTTTTTDRDSWLWSPESGKLMFGAHIFDERFAHFADAIELNDFGQVISSVVVMDPLIYYSPALITTPRVAPIHGARFVAHPQQPSTLVFSPLLISKSIPLEVVNFGNQNVTVRNFKSTSADFSVMPLELTVAAGATGVVEVVWNARANVGTNALISFTSNDPNLLQGALRVEARANPIVPNPAPAPLLAVTRTADHMILSWPELEKPARLEVSDGLKANNWSLVTNVVATNRAFYVTSPAGPTRYFRLALD